MITFSVAMMIMVPMIIRAYKNNSGEITIPGALFVATGLIDLAIVYVVFG